MWNFHISKIFSSDARTSWHLTHYLGRKFYDSPFSEKKFCFIPWFYHLKNFSIQNNQATKKHHLIWHWYKVWEMKYELSILLQTDTGPETNESWFSSLLIIGDFSQCVPKKTKGFSSKSTYKRSSLQVVSLSTYGNSLAGASV